MAEKGKQKADDIDPFRRQAALAILGAFVTRHGGFAPDDRDAHMRLVWQYADAFVALEHAPPPEPGAATEVMPEPMVPARKSRPASPSDEWAVVEGDRRKRGFVSEQEAMWYAAGRPDARVVQVSGPVVAVAAASV